MILLLFSLICGYEWNYAHKDFEWRPEMAIMQNGDTIMITNPNQLMSISGYRGMKLRDKAEDMIKADSTLRDALLTEMSQRMLLNTNLRTEQLRINELETEIHYLKESQEDHTVFIAIGTVQTVAIIVLSIKVFMK
ncbi:MAG: hypothetical protein PHX21_13030 [bacterium]|nr:hypothetical protein [bacterium]